MRTKTSRLDLCSTLTSSRPYTAATQDEHTSPQRLATQSPRLAADSSRRAKADVLDLTDGDEGLIFHSSDFIVTQITDNPKVGIATVESAFILK